MTIQTIQLNKLALSDLNVRKVKPKEIEALAADIQARGVLQNLIGYDEDGKIKICAGGRRYRALKLLQKAKTIPGTFEVPVEIRSKDEALDQCMFRVLDVVDPDAPENGPIVQIEHEIRSCVKPCGSKYKSCPLREV